MNELGLILWGFTGVFFTIYFVNGWQRYRVIQKQKFSFRQHLPFEFHGGAFFGFDPYAIFRWFLFFGTISLFAYWQQAFIYPSLSMTYILLAFMSVWLITFVCVFIYTPRRIEGYLFIVTLFFVTTLAVFFFASYTLWTSPFSQWQSFLPWTTLFQGVFQLMIILNPQLKSWAKLEKIGEANEKPLYRRPHNFVMAYTQWLTIANVFLWVILTQIEWLIG